MRFFQLLVDVGGEARIALGCGGVMGYRSREEE